MTEQELDLGPEALKAEIRQRISRLLESEQSFDGKKLGGFDLPPSSIDEWEG